ncbi:dipeptidyl-peptidase 5 [Devriesea agamarum]|uniref:dipeptidyl-peptidase 5 n=1 Tax=Devriesea agamarum TaxID=472569 RepID=UPI00071DF940|nr:prolyl oligopeptidase family serine peptidase [Devriesea agamarum]
MTTLSYGSWPSPISAQQLATGGVALGGGIFVGDDIWWIEGIAAEEGRQAIVRAARSSKIDPSHSSSPHPSSTGGTSSENVMASADRIVVLPAPYNARSRVHEYGGGSWTTLGNKDPLIVFVNFADQRLYAFKEGEKPKPLTPEGPEVAAAGGPSLRWACPAPFCDGENVIAICEHHRDPAPASAPSPAPAPSPEPVSSPVAAPSPVAHAAGNIERYLAVIPVDGSAATDPSRIRRLTPTSRFVAYPRVSPNGRKLAWISWEHPQMPWDGTQLHIADIRLQDQDSSQVVTGVLGTVVDQVIAGDTSTSVVQPEWLDDDRLVYASDTSGWWNLYEHNLTSGTTRAIAPREEEFAGPMWGVGDTWFKVLDANTLLVTHGTSMTSLSVLNVATGELTPVEAPLTAYSSIAIGPNDQVVLTGASPTMLRSILKGTLVRQDPSSAGGASGVDNSGAHEASTNASNPHVASPNEAGSDEAGSDESTNAIAYRIDALQTVRSSRDDVIDPGALPVPEPITVRGKDGREVHAICYAPRLDGYSGPSDELPPYIAFVHGGPTAQVNGVLSLGVAYYTSRGLGVVDINYGGSTGYGRAYRDRLKGQWGVVDVEDTVAVMDHLVREGIADGARLGIEGGSAGGWTTLACLTRTDRFSAGVSSYGVAELINFIRDTHDFESRYIDGLVGPYPEREDLYRERAPLSHVDELSCPVLLLQGDEDRIVPPSQSEIFRDALAAKGIPHAYLLFPGEQHGFRKAESIIRALEASLSFYGQVFGFDTPGIPAVTLAR